MKRISVALVISLLTLTVVILAFTKGQARLNELMTVPGTVRHSINQAKTKPGFEFVREGRNSVLVENNRTHRPVGSYRCVCNVSAESNCEMVFSPNFVECKSGSCPGNGHCDLVGDVTPPKTNP